ncbi:MAG: helix-turn-helix domain-containing protein [Candidatus Devosia phytovorans]|uniref:Helix-turn-helix domain-containing protein n=1 Tax=Candidatus Devosia phytovorans TaxID=3121372 RepID=A0AAJ5VV20_9HYPH|nr:helix-turn-helix domain-containing protein [Devosia sp.]WEK04097.1 MAG: helix-turn-helix domain-containing protein [Devosia sp.]
MSILATTSQHDLTVLTAKKGKWTLTVITLLREEALRFNEIKRAGGISQKTLTVTLRALERDGFVTRTMFATIPPRVDYELTPMGRDLLGLADALQDFAERNGPGVRAARERFDANGGEPVVKLIHAG